MKDLEKKAHQTSRRDFLKLGGTVAIAGAALGLQACSPNSQEKDTELGSTGVGASDELNIDWDESYDLVIVGGGAAGCAAAIAVAVEGNGANCLLVDKSPRADGNSPYCNGMAISTKDPDAFFEYMKEMRGEEGTTPDDVLRAYADGAAEIFDWVFTTLDGNESEANILPMGSPSDPLSGNPEWPELEHCWSVARFSLGKSKEVEVKGPKHIFDFLLNIVQEHPDVITYRTKSEFTELIQNPVTKEILGAVIDGKNIQALQGVIMCCGGFENNRDMLKNYFGQSAALTQGGAANTGDGHRACMAVGADFWHMSHIAGFDMLPRDLENTAWTFSPANNPKAYGITVGINGRRWYCDWDAVSNWTKPGYMKEINKNVGSRHGHMLFGGDYPNLPQPSKGWLIFDQKGLESGVIADAPENDPIASGKAYKADTIEELAQLIDVPADELQTTVEQWNQCCAEGKDIFFFRPEDTLNPISTPPYYAQYCIPTFLNTDGGPVRSAKAEILDTKGEPIPGLYSSGEFGSIWSGRYQGGGNITECMVFSRIAVKNALGLS